LTKHQETDITTTIIQRRRQHPRRAGRDRSEWVVAIVGMRSADYGVVLGRRQGRSLAGGFADYDRRDTSFNLTFAKPRERSQIDPVVFIERRGKIWYVARQPGGGVYKVCHWISRRVFHLAEALSICGKHKALLAPDTRLDPKAHLLQPGPDFYAAAALARVDQDGNGRAGAEEL
jgi:hypothetical protein